MLKIELPFRAGVWFLKQIQKVGSGTVRSESLIGTAAVMVFGLRSVQKSRIFRQSPDLQKSEDLDTQRSNSHTATTEVAEQPLVPSACGWGTHHPPPRP